MVRSRANNPMGVHHAWGRSLQGRLSALPRDECGYKLRYQNGFDCQGLWVEVEVEKELGLQVQARDRATTASTSSCSVCKQRVLNFAARQTEQSVRLGYWMDWDKPGDAARSCAMR
jgi:isoleucyl-tRNA synthetase